MTYQAAGLTNTDIGDSPLDKTYSYPLGNKKTLEVSSATLPYYVERECDYLLRDWFQKNDSGSLLITGYRGVGKTNCVNHLLKSSDVTGELIPIEINLTVIFPLEELAFIILREIIKVLGGSFVTKSKGKLIGWKVQKFSSKDEKVEFDNLKALIEELYKRLLLKTEIELNLASSGFKVEAGGGIDLLGKMNIGFARDPKEYTREKHSYGVLTESEIVLRLREILQKFQEQKKGTRYVFIFDEIDKIKGFHSEVKEENEKIRDFEELVGKVKLLLLDSRMTYVFVAGRETYYRWQMDKSRGNSVYSSVFEDVIEVEPFLGGKIKHREFEENWKFLKQGDSDENSHAEGVAEVINHYLKETYEPQKPTPESTEEENKRTEFLKDVISQRNIRHSFYRYILWKSRGIPKKIIQELETHIQLRSNTGENRTGNYWIVFDLMQIRRFKFYSGLVKELYQEIVKKELLDNDGILNLIILSDALFKFHRSGFNYADLRLITVAVDQDIVLKNEFYYNLVIKLLDGWWVEKNYGRRSRYIFQPHIKAAIELLANNIQEEAISFRFEKKDFKHVDEYFTAIDERVEGQTDTQRIDSIRVQANLGKINMLMGNDFVAIEYFKKAVRLGIIQMEREMTNDISIGNSRLVSRLMAECYLEIGYILERKQRYKDAMSFYSSAFYISYKSHEANQHRLKFDIKGITGNIVKEPLDEYFTISDESIDALSHMAYLQWKYGQLNATEKLLKDAVEINKQRHNPNKLASQLILLGYFYYRTNQIEKAIAKFSEVHIKLREEEEFHILPNYISNSAHEAIACSFLSKAGHDCDLRNNLAEVLLNLDKTLEHLNYEEDQRRIVEIRQFQLRVKSLELRLDQKLYDSEFIEMINTVFSMTRNRLSDDDFSKMNAISVRLLFTQMGQVAWHIFTYIYPKLMNGNQPDISVSFNNKCLVQEVLKLFKSCKPLLQEIRIRLEKYFHHHQMDGESADFFKLIFDDKDKGVKQIIEELVDAQENSTISEILFFIEMTLQFCFNGMLKYIYTQTSTKPADRLGLFYLIMYCLLEVEGGNKVGTKEHTALLNEARRFLKVALSEQKTYRKYNPDQMYNQAICYEYLAIIGLFELNHESDEEKIEVLQQSIRKDFAMALLSSADDLELTLGKRALFQEVYLKEATLIPRQRMYEIANNRYRFYQIIRKNDIPFDLTNPEEIKKQCESWRRLANTLGHYNYIEIKDELAKWSYRPELRDLFNQVLEKKVNKKDVDKR